MASSSANFNYGYPAPGPQSPTGGKVMDHVFFTSATEWKSVRETQEFDYIVIGSGFCALAFIERAFKNNPEKTILLIERGTLFLPEHFQNLPLPYKSTLGGMSETFPWTLTRRTVNGTYIKWQHGMVPFFGGRSTLWSGWCPRPNRREMVNWPGEVVDAAEKYFPEAEELLNVISADKIDADKEKQKVLLACSDRPIYGVLQQHIQKMLKSGLKKVGSLTRTMPARLAVHDPQLHKVDFSKFSTPAKILEVADKNLNKQNGYGLKIVTGCVVENIIQEDGVATALATSRGIVNIGGAKVILAMGAMPPATLVRNSFPGVKNVGERFTAHFITAIVARVPRADYTFAAKLGDLELGAFYIAGEEPSRKNKGQFHIQLTALSDKDPETNAQTALSHMPDVLATASMEQMLSSGKHIVYVCAVLGELDYANPDNWFRGNDDNDLTVNSKLQVVANENDLAVWNAMDEATFDMLENILSPKKGHVEYWDNDTTSWKKKRPEKHEIRVPGLVHEGSAMHIGGDGEEEDAVVGLDYRPKGVDNVYVTGASLWPTGASWNPTMTMVALAQHLADNLTKTELTEQTQHQADNSTELKREWRACRVTAAKKAKIQ